MRRAPGAGELPGADADNRLRGPLADAFDAVPHAWRSVTDAFRASDQGRSLEQFVDARVRAGALVYPRHVFRALEFHPPESIRVVILGQDPYHGGGQAQGLAFSVAGRGRALPPSLRNILQEVRADTGRASASGGDLSVWARQGVLLLNSALTVEDGSPQSHAGRGWEALTDALFARALLQPQPLVVMLWGASAQRKRALVDSVARVPHSVLVSNHPSPLSARRGPIPFLGSRPFSRANAELARHRPDAPAIDW